MTGPMAAAPRPASSALVDGVDLDAVAAAVRHCPAVDDLYSGPRAEVVSYLPGRRVAGVRIAADHVVISVRGRWGIPVPELARQVRAALATLVGPRRVDVVIADLADASSVRTGRLAADIRGEEERSWTRSSAADAPGAHTSAPIILTATATRPPSPPA
jgi:hypothetical protein